MTEMRLTFGGNEHEQELILNNIESALGAAGLYSFLTGIEYANQPQPEQYVSATELTDFVNSQDDTSLGLATRLTLAIQRGSSLGYYDGCETPRDAQVVKKDSKFFINQELLDPKLYESNKIRYISVKSIEMLARFHQHRQDQALAEQAE